MRIWSALTFLTLLASAVMNVAVPSTVDSQEQALVETRSSIELGPVFDLQAQQDFEQTLDLDEQAALIRLKSIYILPDPDCLLQTTNPRQPFVLRLREALSREFANALSNAGASFVGYVGPNGHIIRADDAASLTSIKGLITGDARVAGTYLMAENDRQGKQVHDLLASGVDFDSEFHVRFWGDVSRESALLELGEWGIEVTYAGYEDNPWVEIQAKRTDIVKLAANVDVEWIGVKHENVTHNADSVALANATPAQIGPGTSYNLDGDGMIVGVWDGGTVRATHDGFQSANNSSILGAGNARVLNLDTTSIGNHPTHVTGTIISDGTGNSSGRGFAPEAYVVAHDWNSVGSERLLARHDYRIVADNHSYGSGGGGNGGYNGTAQSTDIDIRDVLLNTCKSAGNDGSGSNTCGDDTCMKNALVIAAVGDTGNIAGFSSRGPTDDGRLVPHFAANGTGLTSSYATNDSAWNSISGTSMSSPSVCGGVTLLTQLWQREMNNRFFAPDVVRGILATTADDKYNQGPDYRYGFGVIDIKRAADLILSNKANAGKNIIRGSIRQGDVIEYDMVVSSSASPLKVVCSWLDIWASTGASVTLVNNIDIELVEPNGTTLHFPWSGSASNGQTYQWTRTAANNRDNILLAEVDSPTTGTWKVRIKGTSIPANPQSSVLNDSTGFVIVSETDITHRKVVREDSLNSGSAVSVPDNNSTGVTRTLAISDTRTIEAVRVYIDVWHTARGNIDIQLKHPDGTTVDIEQSDTSTRDDIIAVFPDTRQYDDDVNALIGKIANGNWQVIVTDNSSGNTGEIRYLAIEIDLAPGPPPPNQLPTADAGNDFNVIVGTQGALDASGSSDPDFDPLTFVWTQTAGSITLSLSSTTIAQPTFTAPTVSSATVVTMHVTVDDGQGGSDTDTVNVTVMPNQPPTADAGADFSIREEDAGALDGSASSDPEADTLTYAWTQTSGPSATLTNANSATPTFIAPTVNSNQVLQFRLVVDDGNGNSDSDIVNVTVEDNLPPLTDAGPDFSITEGNVGTMNGSATTDPEGDSINYQWTEIGSNTLLQLFSSEFVVQPTFTAPGVASATTITMQLTATDSRGASSSDTVIVTILDNSTNNAPDAFAGNDQFVQYSVTVNLDASGSTDPENDTLTFSWSQVGGAEVVTLSSTTTATLSFTAPSVDATVLLQVTVDDGNGNQDTDQVLITINATGTQPPPSSGGGGGGSSGGCSVAGKQPLLLLLPLLILAFTRRRRHQN